MISPERFTKTIIRFLDTGLPLVLLMDAGESIDWLWIEAARTHVIEIDLTAHTIDYTLGLVRSHEVDGLLIRNVELLSYDKQIAVVAGLKQLQTIQKRKIVFCVYDSQTLSEELSTVNGFCRIELKKK